MSINATSIVRDLAIEVPGATRVFEKLGIDYCCGGAKPLREACSTAGVAVDDVVHSLEQAAVAPTERNEDHDWRDEPLTALVAYILDTHHVFDREELGRIEPLLAKVVSVYLQSHPELVEIQRVFIALKQDLLNHMLKEEQVLFPYIIELQEAADRRAPKPFPFFGTVSNPVRMMLTEHDMAGDMLRSIRELSSNFTVPADACVSYRTLYEALEGLERDLHKHIHLENNLLFPRAVEMEAAN
jgi:regulator of cell morphogenesis and NO signaling